MRKLQYETDINRLVKKVHEYYTKSKYSSTSSRNSQNEEGSEMKVWW
ncbi:MAG: hypothetical protein WAM14_13090 [Candidatus Nitrosopolaris sp.]